MRFNALLTSIEKLANNKNELRFLRDNKQHETLTFYGNISKDYQGRRVEYQGVQIGNVGKQHLHFPENMRAGQSEQDVQTTYRVGMFTTQSR